MNIALAQSEIAQFLECGPQSIPVLWARQDLRRSIHVDHRSNPELSHSSIYDVLEYYLRTEVLVPDDGESELDAWLSAVDEFVESDGIDGRPLEDMVFDLMQIYLDFSGFPCEPFEMAVRGTKTLAAYLSLLGFVEADVRPADRTTAQYQA